MISTSSDVESSPSSSSSFVDLDGASNERGVRERGEESHGKIAPFEENNVESHDDDAEISSE